MRKSTHAVIALAALVSFGLGCGSTTSEGPGTTNRATTQQVVEDQTPPSSDAAECPLFCTRTDDGCRRPDVASPPDSCGAFSMGQLPAPTVECPDRCCAPAAEGPDDDADGVVGAADGCPDAPEDVDGFEDWDGCADPDNDGDGIADVDDRCCYVAEDMDGDQDEDGCAE